MAASVCGLVHLPDEPLDLVTEINERVFAPLIKDLIIRGNQAASWHVPDPGATARYCVVIDIEAINRLRSEPARDPERSAVEAMLRLLGAPNDSESEPTLILLPQLRLAAHLTLAVAALW
ncbi:MAG: hypothetical protein U0Q21_11720 [Dermatophilaceae bacterium]